MADRPSDAVCAFLAEQGPSENFLCLPAVMAPEPAVSQEGGERYMQNLIVHHGLARERTRAELYVVWDDDFWMDQALYREVKTLLKEWPPAVDVTYAKSRFLWNDHRHYRTDFFEHWQHFLWRDRPYCDFTTRLMVHCPEALITQTVGRHAGRLMNAGYLTPRDRKRTFARYKRAGKIDSFVTSLLDPDDKVKLKYL